MIGIVLVTKPPFLFPPSKPINETTTDLIHDYLDRNYVLYDLKVVNWTDMSIPTHFEYLTESAGDHYFIGAIIALSSAIFSASNNIVIAKLVRKVTLFRRLKPITYQSPSNFNLETCFEFIGTLNKNIYLKSCDGFFIANLFAHINIWIESEVNYEESIYSGLFYIALKRSHLSKIIFKIHAGVQNYHFANFSERV